MITDRIGLLSVLLPLLIIVIVVVVVVVVVVIMIVIVIVGGTRSTVRKSWDFHKTDIEIDNTEGAIYFANISAFANISVPLPEI